jgi:hypothetical protein
MTAPERRQPATLCLLAVGLLTVLAGGAPAAAVPNGALESALPLTVDDLIRFDPELARERLAEARERLRHRQFRRDVLVARLNALDAEIADLRQRWRAAARRWATLTGTSRR